MGRISEIERDVLAGRLVVELVQGSDICDDLIRRRPILDAFFPDQLADPGKIKALIKDFRTLLVRTYSTSLSQYRNQTIEVKPSRVGPQDKDAVVRTAVIQQGGPPIPIDYSMEKADGGWKVFDVVIDGASLVTTYRGTFNDQVQRGGLDGLIKALQERNRAPEPPKPPTKK